MASKPTITGKIRGTGSKPVQGLRYKTTLTAGKQKTGQVQRSEAVTVDQGTSGGFVVYGSPIQPRHTSVDRIAAAVLALKTR